MGQLRFQASIIVFALLSAAVACGRSGSPSTAPVVIAPGSTGPEPAPPPVASKANPSTGRIRCGKEVCDTTTAICCGFSGDERCAPNRPPVRSDVKEERLRPLIDSCQQTVKSEYSFDFLGTCDDTSDCPQGQVCCSQWLWSGAGLFECIPASAAGDSVCDYHERCTVDSCATRGTRCTKNECRLASAKVRCDGVVCGGDKTVCCQRGFEGPPRCERDCEPPDEDSRAFEFECSSSSGCPPGAYCQAGMFGSFCAPQIDTANAVMLCESDKDCLPDGCAWMGKKNPPVCKLGDRGSFTYCSCD